jgi:3-hydroxyacyl-[acyl-carrier-protein] dehydratase
MESHEIISRLPYSNPFLFVDEILAVDENSVSGKFTFREDLSFFSGHFTDRPVVPGVILIEVMAQIGVACLGVYLLKNCGSNPGLAMTSAEAEFLTPVYPRETVYVKSIKNYFRFNKLNCTISMQNENNIEVATAKISGMIII